MNTKTQWALVFILGLAVGTGFMLLMQHEWRWIIFMVAAILAATIFLAIPNKESFLTTIFIISLQIDVYIRLLYGYAGNKEGLAFPMVIFAGVALLLVTVLSRGERVKDEWRLAGAAGPSIALLLATSFISLCVSSYHFDGASRFLFELELFFVYWMSFNLVQTERDAEKILTLLFVTLAIQASVYYLQSALGITFSLTGEIVQEGDIARPGGTVSSNPAGYSSFITPPLCMSFATFLTTRHSRSFLLLPILVGFGAGAIGLTFTRGAWIGLLLGLAVIVWRASRAHMLDIPKLTAMAVGVVVMALALLPKMLERLASDYGEDAGSSSADERLGLIRIAINVIIGNPIFGVGPGAYDNEYRSYVPAGLSQWLSTVHNEFLLRTAETGLLGGFAFVWFVYSGFRVASRLYRSPDINTKVLGIGWAAGLASLMVQMNLVPWRGFSYNAMLWLFMGLMDGIDRLHAQRQQAKEAYAPKAGFRPVEF